MSKIITVEEMKSWHYYKWKCKDFPKIPQKVEDVIYARKKKDSSPFIVRDESTKISLRAFRTRVKNYLKDHLPNQGVALYNPNFNKKEIESS